MTNPAARASPTDAERIRLAIEIAVEYGQIDGAHHKMWVVDRMPAVNRYGQVVASACDGNDDPDTYEWDEGIAP